MDNRYKKSAGCVYNVKYHLVWCPKYRRQVLTDKIANRLKELLNIKAKELGIEIQIMEIMPDHVHVFVTGQPTDPIQYIVNQFKGYSSRILRLEFRELRSKLPTLWSRSYYVGTVGHVNEETVRRYIEAQKGK
jgi:putative transposase